MSDAAVETKTEKTPVATPEKEKPAKEVAADEKSEAAVEEKEEAPSNGDVKKNGKEAADKDEKEKTESEEAPVENGVAKDGEAVAATKRKSEVADVADGKVEGVSPEKKAKLDEKVENGEAEATA